MSQLNLFDKPIRAPNDAYYNTTHESGDDLRRYEKSAENQNHWVLLVMRELKEATPSQVQQRCAGNPLLTSVRRSMHTLTARGLLAKTDRYAKGPYGRREHVWELLKSE